MKTFFLSALLAAVLLTGCTAKPVPTYPLASQPTLPSFSQVQTPLEQLEQAREQLHLCGSFRVTFPGGIQYVELGEAGYESLIQTEAGLLYYGPEGCWEQTGDEPWVRRSVEPPFAREQMFASLYERLPNESFFEDFCAGRLTVSPSNDGSFSFQQTELTLSQLYTLIYGKEPEGTLPEGVGIASVTVGPEGCLSEISFQTYLGDGTRENLTLRFDLFGEADLASAYPQEQE